MSAAAERNPSRRDAGQLRGHGGPLVSHASGFDVIDCGACGFRHVVPLPDPVELEKEYAEVYYSEAKPTYLADASRDQDWARLTQDDRLDAIERALGRCGSLLEIGSGPGFFLDRAIARGWSAMGVEPSIQAARFSQQRGLNVFNCTIADAARRGLASVDAIAATNVLEHIADPIGTLEIAASLLSGGGVACITVPNDFNPLQKVAQRGMGQPEWWVAPPHHLNYFDFDSLDALLRRAGLIPVERLTSFPMEAFLLMGDDYVRESETGKACHRKRMNFDMAFETAGMGDVRRAMYAALAAAGIGREATIVAVKP
jgi:SAM-dependent methyltransferase